YMAVGGDTYAGDLLRLAGGENVFEQHRTGARYPQVTLDDIIAADPELILLPDEPYRFSERHRDEILTLRGLTAARDERVFLCDGRWLTWYGPRIGEALRGIAELLDRARPHWTPPPDEPDEEEVRRTRRQSAKRKKRTAAKAKTPRARATKPQGGTSLPPGLQLNVETRDVVYDEG
ncbi:MAG: helical backbone metal receptor, partial [Dehalococcoidia bacterium]